MRRSVRSATPRASPSSSNSSLPRLPHSRCLSPARRRTHPTTSPARSLSGSGSPRRPCGWTARRSTAPSRGARAGSYCGYPFLGRDTRKRYGCVWFFFSFLFFFLVGLDHKYIGVPTRTMHLVRCSSQKPVERSPMDAVYRWILAWGVRWARISAWSPHTPTFTKRSSRLLLRRVRTSRLYSYILVCKSQMAVGFSSHAGDEILNVLCGAEWGRGIATAVECTDVYIYPRGNTTERQRLIGRLDYWVWNAKT